MTSFPYVNVAEFTPNDGGWTEVGNVDSYNQDGTVIQLIMSGGGSGPKLYFYSPTVFRVRFNPAGDYSTDNSYAVVNKDFGFSASRLSVEDAGGSYEISTGEMTVRVNKAPYAISVYRNGQLIHQDTPSYNLIYDNQAVANFKVAPDGAYYYGFGEKAGSKLAKNNLDMTFFNFDNFEYLGTPGIVPDGQNGQPNESGGPLNPAEPLYNSTPFLVETNPNPTGDYSGAAYSYGLFFDNVAQSYFNITANDYSDMTGKYYFGALYNDIDYYFMLGTGVSDVLAQFTRLTGPAPIPPMYAFGFQQGCYGYYDRAKLEAAASAYRAAAIPIDGLHIDVDFQNNYRTFTNSNMKFPDVADMFANLKQQGFKCSTNITSLISANPLDETGRTEAEGGAPYPARDSGLALKLSNGVEGAFLFDSRYEAGESQYRFIGNEGYGDNYGTNPYPYPPLTPQNGVTPLGSYGYYPDFGNPEVREWWGQQYEYLFSVGLEMIWQDMTCPALIESPGCPGSSTPPEQAAPPELEGGQNNCAPESGPFPKTFPQDLMQSSFGTFKPNAHIHNAYSLNLCHATYDGINKLRPDKRNFIIARGGYAGVHRYAGLWTGDSASSWDFLKINIPEVLNMGLSGQPIAGCDIGGFGNGSASSGHQIVGDKLKTVQGGITEPRLLARWMTMGAFLPWFRNHYDGYTKEYQEPYRYADPVPSICRRYVEIRYKLLQVIYDAMYACSNTGSPIVRPLFWEFSSDSQTYSNADNQFMLGDSILVAPVVEQADHRSVYLPAGTDWYVYKDGKVPLDSPHPGGTTASNWYCPFSLESVQPDEAPYFVPIYVRAGAIIPMRRVEQWVGQLPANPLTFDIYPGPDRSYTLYQDDGVSRNNTTKREYRLTEISHQTSGNSQTVTVNRKYDKYTPAATYYDIGLLATQSPAGVTVNGTPVSETPANGQSPDEVLEGTKSNAWTYDSATQTTVIRVIDNQSDVTVSVQFS